MAMQPQSRNILGTSVSWFSVGWLFISLFITAYTWFFWIRGKTSLHSAQKQPSPRTTTSNVQDSTQINRRNVNSCARDQCACLRHVLNSCLMFQCTRYADYSGLSLRTSFASSLIRRKTGELILNNLRAKIEATFFRETFQYKYIPKTGCDRAFTSLACP